MHESARYVDVGDTRLHVVERGDGFPVVVLHGGPGLDHHQFANYLDPLTDAYRLVLVDQRSHGRSDPAPRGTWTVAHLAADVTALADALGYAAYAVLGHSFGALVALQHAVDFSGHPCGTVVSCPAPSTRWTRGLAEQFADPRDPRIEDMTARTAATERKPDVLRHFAAARNAVVDVEPELKTVEHPVLVLAGRHDRTCPAETANLVADGIADAGLAVFEHSGHFPYVEENARYLEVVRDFLDGVRR